MPSRDSARETVLRFIRLGQARQFDEACTMMDNTRYGDQTLYDDLQVAALASLTSNASSPEKRKRELDRKRALATSCRGVLAVIFAEVGSRSTQLAAKAARKPALWLGPGHTAVVLGGDEAWTLTLKGGKWRISGANALVDATG
jgi:hypothetical protein